MAEIWDKILHLVLSSNFCRIIEKKGGAGGGGGCSYFTFQKNGRGSFCKNY